MNNFDDRFRKGDFRIQVKAENLLSYTIKAVSNTKYYPNWMRGSLVRLILDKNASILDDIIAANGTRINAVRIGYQEKVIRECDQLLAMIGRGTLDGLDRMKQFMAQSWRIYGADCSVLKGDIHHFFASIDREDAARKARRQIEDDKVFELFMRYLNNFDGGLPLGLRTSQPLANLVLNDMDHYIKESLGCRWYGRYMDDFYIIHPDRDFLKYARGEIEAGLSKIGLSLNNKTQIFPIQHGIDFLGFRTYMTDTGKVIRKVREQSRRGMGRRLRHFQDLYLAGVMTEEEIRMHYQCWRAHAEHGNSRGLILRYDAKVEKIFK